METIRIFVCSGIALASGSASSTLVASAPLPCFSTVNGVTEMVFVDLVYERKLDEIAKACPQRRSRPRDRIRALGIRTIWRRSQGWDGTQFP